MVTVARVLELPVCNVFTGWRCASLQRTLEQVCRSTGETMRDQSLRRAGSCAEIYGSSLTLHGKQGIRAIGVTEHGCEMLPHRCSAGNIFTREMPHVRPDRGARTRAQLKNLGGDLGHCM